MEYTVYPDGDVQLTTDYGDQIHLRIADLLFLLKEANYCHTRQQQNNGEL